MVVDPDHPIMQDNLYWLVISDLVNLLNHKRIAFEFISSSSSSSTALTSASGHDSDHINMWFAMLTYFQTMNLNVRKFGDHVQQEQPTYFSAFSAELECCSSVMWSIVQHLSTDTEPERLYALKLIKLSFERLRNWLNDIGFMTSLMPRRPNYKHLSFHLPLHRFKLLTLSFNRYIK